MKSCLDFSGHYISPQANPLWGGKMVYHIDDNFINSVGGYKNMKDDLDIVYINKLEII